MQYLLSFWGVLVILISDVYTIHICIKIFIKNEITIILILLYLYVTIYYINYILY